jgi:type II secretory pathway pseudopilin PulG
MGTGSIAWELLVVVGPLLLIGAIVWATLHNRQSRRGEQRTEQATHDLYKAQDAADKSGESHHDR